MNKLVTAAVCLAMGLPALAQQDKDASGGNLFDTTGTSRAKVHTPGSATTVKRHLRYWDDGPLTLDDFTLRRNEPHDIAFLDCHISWTYGSHKIGNTFIITPQSHTEMRPFASWINPDYRNERTLLYLQTAFDYMELHRRIAQERIDRRPERADMADMASQIQEAESIISQMSEYSRQGQDSLALLAYSAPVRSELEMTGQIQNSDMKLRPRGTGASFYSGIGTEIFTGEMGSYLRPATGWDFGVAVNISSVKIFANGLLGGGGRYRKDIPTDGYKWDAGRGSSTFSFDISPGITVYDSRKLKLTPFAGLGAGVLYYPDNPSGSDRSDSISGLRVVAGVSSEFKILRLVSYDWDNSVLAELAVRARLFAARTYFSSPGPAWSINFGLGINLMAFALAD